MGGIIHYLTPYLQDAVLVLKLKLLIQMALAIVLGVRSRRFNAGPMFAAIIAGSTLLVAMKSSATLGFSDLNYPLGVHAGLWALALNLLVLLAAEHFFPTNKCRKNKLRQ